MNLNELGEFGLIKRFRRNIKTDSSVIKGSGDDCAVLKFNQDSYQLFTCDMLVEGADFTKKTDLVLVGRNALAVSISDIAACCGIPKYAVISLGLPKKMKVSQADLLAKGIFDLAKKFKINIVGGDISAADKLIADLKIFGAAIRPDFGGGQNAIAAARGGLAKIGQSYVGMFIFQIGVGGAFFVGRN